MPEIWNNIAVVTQKELEPWFTYDALQKHIKRHEDKKYGIKKARSGGNGRQLLIIYDSLPGDIKNVLQDPRKLDHILSLYYKTDPEAIKFFQDFQFEDGQYLSLQHQEQYITNASVIVTLFQMREARIEERRSKGGAIKRGLLTSLLNDAITFNPVLESKHKVKHTLPTSERRFKKALNEFEKDGYKTLISKRHRNTNSKKMTDELLGLLNSLFTTDAEKPHRTEVARRYNAFLDGYIIVTNMETGEQYDPKSFKAITEASIRNWLGKWNQRIATYAMRTGNRQQWIQQFKPYHSLVAPKYAGEIISIDDRQPPFSYGSNKRAWFYLGIDLGSEVFTTHVFGKSKEGIIKEFYRQMVKDYYQYGWNLPWELEAESSLNSSFKDTFLKEGRMFQEVRIEANNARGKRIERYFRDLRYGFEKQQEGWIARPFAGSESNQIGPNKAPELPYGTIINNSKQIIAKWNNMPHSKHKDISRFDWHNDNQNPKLKPTNYRGIIPFLGNRTSTTCNAGIVRFFNSEFLIGDYGKILLGERLINVLSVLEDNHFDVYWLDSNDLYDGNGTHIIKAYAYIGDQFICELIAKPTYSRSFLGQTSQDRENRELMSQYVATITGYMQSKKRSIDRVYVEDNRTVELNQNFKIRGINGEILHSHESKNYDDTSVEVLPEIIEDQSTEYNSNRKSFKDRF